ncbi:hypothetical protein [Natrialbaceae archaeon AArc-T1-2]|uniref:hypothetical protein n=1 Tax=Natrialbaceae archaeon AArc-T1-2 TaxID=3053904 RepID=UPI00255A93F0|nr:hypothetical protein [Natrialbaceae archaeon AArc-T1-2]WIV66330.1 hypothetical protein QQ977_11585 [Natrialbaceae archaeon AArc-T1-2]
MSVNYECPLCADEYEAETDLRVHLEVEHRKSELATHIVSNESTTDSTVKRDELTPSARG